MDNQECQDKSLNGPSSSIVIKDVYLYMEVKYTILYYTILYYTINF